MTADQGFPTLTATTESFKWEKNLGELGNAGRHPETHLLCNLQCCRCRVFVTAVVTTNTQQQTHSPPMLPSIPLSCCFKCVESFKWEKFLGELGDAVQQQQPTLFLAEHVNSLTTTYPDLFYALPQLRPSEPLVRAGLLAKV